MASTKELQFDQRTGDQRQNEAGGHHAYHGLPGGVLGGVEDLEQSTQLTDVGGGTFAIQTDIGHGALGATLSCVLDQSLKFVQRYGYPAVSGGRYHRCVHCGLQKQEIPHEDGVGWGKGFYGSGCGGDDQCGLSGGLLSVPGFGFARLAR